MNIVDNKNVWKGLGFGEAYDLAVETLQLIDHVLRHPARKAPTPEQTEMKHPENADAEIHTTIYRAKDVVAYYIGSDYGHGCEAYVVINLKNDRVYVHSFTPEFVFDGEKIWFIPTTRDREHERGYTINPNMEIADKIEAWGCDGNSGPDGEPYVSNPRYFHIFMQEIDAVANILNSSNIISKI